MKTKIYKVLLLILMITLTSCSTYNKENVNDYRYTFNLEYVRSYKDLIDSKRSVDGEFKEVYSIGKVTSYEEFEKCFDTKIKHDEYIFSDVYQKKDDYFKKNGLLFISYSSKYFVKVEILEIEFKGNELIITVNYVNSEYQSAIPEYYNNSHIIYEVPVKKLAKVEEVKIVKYICDDMYYSK